MKRLSQITESIWSDIQDRSSGETVRKEDDVMNMDMESFWLYLIKNYKERVKTLDKDHFCKDYDMDIVVDPSKDIVIFGSYVKDELVRIMVVLKTKVTDVTVKKIIDTSPDNFRWIRINSDKLELALNNGDVTNQTFVDLIEFFLNNQQVFESIWSDIQDRSAGEIIRDEDKFNPDYVDFGPDTTVYWAIDNLEIDGEVKFYFDDVKDYNNNGWRLPTVDEVNQLKWNIRIPWYDGCKHLKFDGGNELRLKTNGSGGFHMWTKEINTKFPSSAYAYGFNNSNDFDVTNFNKSFNRLFVFLVKDKKITESIWSDIQDRSSGETVRKEDEITNIKSLKPIDMGGSVLWADDDLSLKDGDCYFTFDEVFELVKNSGWRLPTLEEVAELDDVYKKGSFWENDDRFVFDGFPHQLVFFKKGLIYTSASDEPIDEDYYYCWTSTLFLNNNRFANIFTFNDGKPCHTPLNDQRNVNDSVTQDITNGKLCVRLVKDK